MSSHRKILFCLLTKEGKRARGCPPRTPPGGICDDTVSEVGETNCVQGSLPLATNGSAVGQGSGVVAPPSFGGLTESRRFGEPITENSIVFVISKKDPTGSRVKIRKSRMLAFAEKPPGSLLYDSGIFKGGSP